MTCLKGDNTVPSPQLYLSIYNIEAISCLTFICAGPLRDSVQRFRTIP